MWKVIQLKQEVYENLSPQEIKKIHIRNITIVSSALILVLASAVVFALSYF